MRHIFLTSLFVLSGILILTSVDSAVGSDEFFIGVTLLPQKFFVEQITGKRAQVITLIPQGADPHTYEPKPKDIEMLKKAKVFFALGEIEVEKIWLDRFKKLFPQLKIVNTSSDIAFREGHHHDHHAEKASKKHHEGGKDPHVWLSPPLVMLQSRAIYKTLLEVDPEGKPYYDEGFKNWMSKLVNLDMELTNMLASFRGRIFLIYHPAWTYFAEAYGIKQIAVEREGKPPGPKDLDELKNVISKNNIRVLFVTSEMPQVNAQKIAQQFGLTLDVLNPLDYDWEANMRKVAGKLVSSWKLQ